MADTGVSAGSWIPLVGDALNAVSALGGTITNMQMQDRAFLYNQRMSDQEFIRNSYMWDLQNQYNSPQSQLERIKQAGINPNIAFGSGVSATTGNNQSRPSYRAPQYVAPSIQGFQASGIYNVAQEIRANRLLNGDLEVKKTEAKKNTATAIKTLLESKNIKELMPYQIEKLIAEIAGIQQRTEREDFELRRAELLLPGEQLLQQLHITDKSLDAMFKDSTLEARVTASFLANALTESQININHHQAKKLLYDTINTFVRTQKDYHDVSTAFNNALISTVKAGQYQDYGMTKEEYEKLQQNWHVVIANDADVINKIFKTISNHQIGVVDAIIPF